VCLFDPVDVASEKLVMLKFWYESGVAYKIIERLTPPKSVGRRLIELKVTARPLLSTLKKIAAIMFIHKIMHIRIISISANPIHFHF
jgi:hypothetical protein